MLSVVWDVDALLDALGGPQTFANECRARGWGNMTPRVVQKWRERARIPPYGLAAAALILRERGVTITTFIHTRQGRSGLDGTEAREDKPR